MPGKFHERFDIEIGIDEARRRFVNRAENLFSELLSEQLPNDMRMSFERAIVSALGEVYDPRKLLGEYIGSDFYTTLHALEEFYNAFSRPKFCSTYTDENYFLLQHRLLSYLEENIARLFTDSELDLGVCWEKGHFVKSGAKLLDEKLVNDMLKWLRVKGYENVLAPYEKGLSHFLQAEKHPEFLADVVTDIYESLEALAKIITKRPTADLSANRDLFIKEVKASHEYKNLLKEYIMYANKFRHAAQPGTPKPALSIREVESFIYLTGIFIRLAMPTEQEKQESRLS